MTFQPTPEQSVFLACSCQVISLEGPAGTGKTTIAAIKAAHFAKVLAEQERVLFLTFTNNAVDRIGEAVREHVAVDLRRKIHLTNYHEFFFGMIVAWGRYAGLPRQWSMMSRAERLTIYLPIAQRHGLAVRRRAMDADAWFARTQSMAAGYLPRGQLPPDLVQESANALRLANRQGSIHYDDFEFYARWLLTNDAVRRLYKRAFPVIFCDEFQDITDVQYQLLTLIEPRHLIAVGDPRQSIYRWIPGVRPARFREFISDHRPTRHPLTINKRSPGLTESNALAEGILNLASGRSPFSEHRPLPEGDSLRWYAYEDRSDAYQSAASLLVEEKKRYPATACLLPTNAEVREFGGVATEVGLECSMLFDTTMQSYLEDVVISVTAYLLGGLMEDWWLIGRVLYQMTGQAQWREAFSKGPVSDAYESDEVVDRLARSILTSSSGTLEESLDRSVEIVEEIICGEEMEASDFWSGAVGRVADAQRVANLRGASMSALRSALIELRVADERRGRSQLRRGVTVMTMHKAVGKEFDLVYLLAPSDGEFLRNAVPGSGQVEDDGQVWYVAVSRHRKMLSVFYQSEMPSRFIRPFLPDDR